MNPWCDMQLICCCFELWWRVIFPGKFDITAGAVDCREESGIVKAGNGLLEVPWSSSDGMLRNTCWGLVLVTGNTSEGCDNWSEARFFMIFKRRLRRSFLTPESCVDWRLRWDFECRIICFVRDSESTIFCWASSKNYWHNSTASPVSIQLLANWREHWMSSRPSCCNDKSCCNSSSVCSSCEWENESLKDCPLAACNSLASLIFSTSSSSATVASFWLNFFFWPSFTLFQWKWFNTIRKCNNSRKGK